MPLRCTLQRLSKKSGSDAFAAYSNPAAGAFTVNSISSGDFILYNAQHALIAKYPVVKGVNKLQLPATLAPGIYIGDYQATDGKSSQVIRLVYRP